MISMPALICPKEFRNFRVGARNLEFLELLVLSGLVEGHEILLISGGGRNGQR